MITIDDIFEKKGSELIINDTINIDSTCSYTFVDHKKLLQWFKPWQESLSIKEKIAIMCYRISSKHINKSMQSAAPNCKAKKIQEALNGSNKYLNENIIVYRTIAKREFYKDISSWEVGEKRQLSCFKGTHVKKIIKKDIQVASIICLVDKDTEAAYIGNYIKCFSKEREFIISQNNVAELLLRDNFFDKPVYVVRITKKQT